MGGGIGGGFGVLLGRFVRKGIVGGSGGKVGGFVRGGIVGGFGPQVGGCCGWSLFCKWCGWGAVVAAVASMF